MNGSSYHPLIKYHSNNLLFYKWQIEPQEQLGFNDMIKSLDESNLSHKCYFSFNYKKQSLIEQAEDFPILILVHFPKESLLAISKTS
jgi:hypothetical protein